MSTEETATENQARGETRYPLAYDANGNPLEVPEHAVGWRVRRGGGRRGRPRHVFDAETGRQLEMPLGAGLDDLIDAGCEADRYLLYPIDSEGRVIAGIVAVTEVPDGAAEESAGSVESAASIEKSVLLATIREQGMTIRHQADSLTRSLEATTSGYGRVRAVEPAPVVVEQPAAPVESGGSFKPEQIAEIANIARAIFDMFKSGGAAAPATEGTP